MQNYFLALVETASNQRFIFQSNKLREVLGASELVRRAGIDFVESAKDAGGFAGRVECCLSTSGKALLKFENQEDASEFIFRLTRKALVEAPGLGVYGAISEPISKDGSPKETASIIRALFERLAQNRLHLAAPETRFGHLPIVSPCRSSGLPAARTWKDPDGNGFGISAIAAAKRAASRMDKRNGVETGCFAADRLHKDFGQLRICADPDLLEKTQCAWFGVLHADGNGFGEVFMNLDQCLPSHYARTADGLLAFYADLSAALDAVGKAATVAATASLVPLRIHKPDQDDPKSVLPLVPLVMGGDDLTVIVDGAQALAFARAYVQAFEQLASADQLIGRLTRNGQHLIFGAAVGIAIVKPHHPFYRAYELSEQLLASAKVVKKVLGAGASALDYQVLYGDTTSDLADMRRDWRIGEAGLSMRPYVISDPARYAGRSEAQQAWAERRQLTKLDAARAALSVKVATDGEERLALPRSQQHVLRDALFSGLDGATAALDLIRYRYPGVNFGVFGDETELFCSDDSGWPEGMKSATRATRLLDAMQLEDVSGNNRQN